MKNSKIQHTNKNIICISISIILIIALSITYTHFHKTTYTDTFINLQDHEYIAKHMQNTIFKECKDIDITDFMDVYKSYKTIHRWIQDYNDMFQDIQTTPQQVLKYKNNIISNNTFIQVKKDIPKIHNVITQLSLCKHKDVQTRIEIIKAVFQTIIDPLHTQLAQTLQTLQT